MRVQEADMSYKKQKGEAQKEVSEEKSGFKKARKDVEKIKRMTKEMNDKLADWSDEEISAVPDNIKPASKWDKCVIAKGLFTLDEIKVSLREHRQAISTDSILGRPQDRHRG